MSSLSEAAIQVCQQFNGQKFWRKRVIAIDVDDKKLALAKEVGADVVINSLKEDPLEVVAAHTDGLNADLVVEAAGSPITSAQVFAYAKKVEASFSQGFHTPM